MMKTLRLNRSRSQKQMAYVAGISTRMLQHIEIGADASAEILKCLSAALDNDFTLLRKEQNTVANTTA